MSKILLGKVKIKRDHSKLATILQERDFIPFSYFSLLLWPFSERNIEGKIESTIAWVAAEPKQLFRGTPTQREASVQYSSPPGFQKLTLQYWFPQLFKKMNCIREESDSTEVASLELAFPGSSNKINR
jgi:hypothetical protein